MKQLVPKLNARLQPYVDGDHAGFESWGVKEAERLAEGSFAEALLHTIG